jgi:surfeit locus 1 family protein
MRGILFLLTFGLTGLGVLLWLGAWQVQRLTMKQEIIDRIDARVLADPVDLPANPDLVGDKYLAVKVSGTMLPGEVNVLVSLKSFGPGYRVIAPFELSDGRRIMVDRGFITTEQKNAERQTGEMQITGNLHWPIEIDSFTPAPEKAGNIWFARDVPDMADTLKTEPVLLVARTRNDPTVTPTPVDSANIPNNHLNYAITWFSLALVWAGMTVYFLWRNRAPTGPASESPNA